MVSVALPLQAARKPTPSARKRLTHLPDDDMVELPINTNDTIRQFINNNDNGGSIMVSRREPAFAIHRIVE